MAFGVWMVGEVVSKTFSFNPSWLLLIISFLFVVAIVFPKSKSNHTITERLILLVVNTCLIYFTAVGGYTVRSSESIISNNEKRTGALANTASWFTSNETVSLEQYSQLQLKKIARLEDSLKKLSRSTWWSSSTNMQRMYLIRFASGLERAELRNKANEVLRTIVNSTEALKQEGLSKFITEPLSIMYSSKPGREHYSKLVGLPSIPTRQMADKALEILRNHNPAFFEMNVPRIQLMEVNYSALPKEVITN